MLKNYDLSVLQYYTDGAFQRVYNDFYNELQRFTGQELDKLMQDPETQRQINAGLTLAACLYIRQTFTASGADVGSERLMHELLGYVCGKAGIDRYGQIAGRIK